VALHEHFPAVASGEVAGTVRIEPNAGVPAGFMIRLDPAKPRMMNRNSACASTVAW
jgi:hypothetical protein